MLKPGSAALDAQLQDIFERPGKSRPCENFKITAVRMPMKSRSSDHDDDIDPIDMMVAEEIVT